MIAGPGTAHPVNLIFDPVPVSRRDDTLGPAVRTNRTAALRKILVIGAKNRQLRNAVPTNHLRTAFASAVPVTPLRLRTGGEIHQAKPPGGSCSKANPDGRIGASGQDSHFAI